MKWVKGSCKFLLEFQESDQRHLEVTEIYLSTHHCWKVQQKFKTCWRNQGNQLIMFLVRAVVVLAIVAQAASLGSSVCENVYPHLSCGLTHSSESSCQTAGCCWDGTNCFAPKIYGYEYTAVSDEPGVMTGTLSLNQPSGIAFGADFSTLNMVVTQESESRTHIKITPPGEARWEIPDSILPRPGGVYTGTNADTKTIIKPQNDDDEYNNMEILITRSKNGTPTGELIFAFTKMVCTLDILTFY